MKKIISWLLVLLVLCAASAAPAEDAVPMYATVSEALAAAGRPPIAGGDSDYYAVVTEKDGKYYRSVAYTDSVYDDLQEDAWNADLDHISEAFSAIDDYLMSLPVSYTEELTGVPLSREEIDGLVGRTLGELENAGFVIVSSGQADDDVICYELRWRLYAYSVIVDADFDTYEKALWENRESQDGFMVKTAECIGLSRDAYMLSILADGSEQSDEDPFADCEEIAEAFAAAAERLRDGGEVDMEELAEELKEKDPDLAEQIDAFLLMYELFGADALDDLD